MQSALACIQSTSDEGLGNSASATEQLFDNVTDGP